jgi:hypothetical protein
MIHPTIRYSIFMLVLLRPVVAFCQITEAGGGGFDTYVAVEPATDSARFLVKKDGTILYWNKVDKLSFSAVTLDGRKIPLAEVRGIRNGDYFYAPVADNYARRIVRGKLNVYIVRRASAGEKPWWMGANGSSGNFVQGLNYLDQVYLQEGDSGPLKTLNSRKDIISAVQSCPLALSMANKSDSELKKAIRADHRYLNEIFEIYNNNCQPLTPQ